MAIASIASTTQHHLRVPLSRSSASPLWRSTLFQFLRTKQEKWDTCIKGTGVSFLNLEGAHFHNQPEWQLYKKGSMPNFSGHCRDMVVVANSKQEQKLTIETTMQESVDEADGQSHQSYSIAEECGNASFENGKVDLFLSCPQLVYKRRSRRNPIVGEAPVTEDLDIEVKVLPGQGWTDEGTTNDVGRISRNRKETKRSYLHKGPERAMQSQLTLESSQETENETVKNSRKKRVTAKTSQKRDMETAKGSKKRKVVAKVSQCVAGETKTSQDGEMAICSNGMERTSEGIDATRSGNHSVDAFVKITDPWLQLAHKKAQIEWNVYNPRTMRLLSNPQSNFLKLLSWNVNGLRALLKGKGGQEPGAAILQLAEKENFDVLSLQETKLQEKDVLAIKEALLPGYDSSLWSCSTAKLGYSGTAVITRVKPLSVAYGLGIKNHDNEGRAITVEFENFFLVTCYVPNSGQKLERLAYRTEDWDICLGKYLKDLEKRKPVILTGDLNCAHQEIDIYNPDGNRRSAGFTDEERASFEKNFLQRGLTDTFRRQHPNTIGYTYWGYRTAARPKNQGWRLDYFLTSDALLDVVHDSYILPDVEGSDHCPIGLTLRC